MIECLVTGKWYIGQTMKQLSVRRNHHVRSSERCNYKFYRAIRKYGVENFVIEEIMWVEAPNKQSLKRKLDFLERHFIARYDTKRRGYNSTEGGDGVLGLHHSESSKKKMSGTWFKKGLIPWNKGTVGVVEAWNKQGCFSIGSRLKLSKTNQGKKPWNAGKRLSEEHRRKLSEGHKHVLNRTTIARHGIIGVLENKEMLEKLKSGKYIRVVEQYSLDGEYIQTFESANLAKKTLNISNISGCCKGKYNTAGGFIWRYKLKERRLWKQQ